MTSKIQIVKADSPSLLKQELTKSANINNSTSAITFVDSTSGLDLNNNNNNNSIPVYGIDGNLIHSVPNNTVYLETGGSTNSIKVVDADNNLITSVPNGTVYLDPNQNDIPTITINDNSKPFAEQTTEGEKTTTPEENNNTEEANHLSVKDQIDFDRISTTADGAKNGNFVHVNSEYFGDNGELKIDYDEEKGAYLITENGKYMGWTDTLKENKTPEPANSNTSTPQEDSITITPLTNTISVYDANGNFIRSVENNTIETVPTITINDEK